MGNVAETFHEDASIVGVKKELQKLVEIYKIAISDLPFPEELDIEGEDWTSKAIDIGIGAIADILSSGSPKRNIKRSVENEFQG